jgi:preprotein translocase subunit SecG
MAFLFYFSLGTFILLTWILSLVILVQESKSLGFGASFGGNAGESLFGTSTADVLKKFTAYAAVGFMALCVLLSFWTGSMARNSTKSLPITIEQSE